MPVKPFLTYEQQLAQLKTRGLHIGNESEALHCLQHLNYYRLSAYRFSFQQSEDCFQSGTSFTDLVSLYHFDRKLRFLVSEACKTLEIACRARWAYVMGQAYGELAYEEASAFAKRDYQIKHLESLDRELNRSKEVFVKHYTHKYGMQRPPIWAASECMSFGLLSQFYANVKQARLKKEIASTFQLTAKGLEAFLKQATYLRNLCAHHSRLWNRSLTITISPGKSWPSAVEPALNRASNPSNPSDRTERLLYNSLAILTHVTELSTPEHQWKRRLVTHLKTLNRPDHSEMGFPSGWEHLDFWK